MRSADLRNTLRPTETTRLIKEAGIHILAVINAKKGAYFIYDLYQFRLRNLAGDTLELAYKVPAGTRPPNLIRDLEAAKKAGVFFKAELREKNGMLVIINIREPEMSQDELRSWMPESKRVILTR